MFDHKKLPKKYWFLIVSEVIFYWEKKEISIRFIGDFLWGVLFDTFGIMYSNKNKRKDVSLIYNFPL